MNNQRINIREINNEDLRMEWDMAIERNNHRRAEAIEREMRRRDNEESIEI